MFSLDSATQVDGIGRTAVEVAAVVLFGGLLLTPLWIRALYASPPVADSLTQALTASSTRNGA